MHTVRASHGLLSPAHPPVLVAGNHLAQSLHRRAAQAGGNSLHTASKSVNSEDCTLTGDRARWSLTHDLNLTHTLVLFRVSGHGARSVGRDGTDQQNKSKIMSMIKSMKKPTTPGTARRSMGRASAGFRSPTWRGHSKMDWTARCRSPGRGRAHPVLPYGHYAAERSPFPERERAGVRAGVTSQ